MTKYFVALFAALSLATVAVAAEPPKAPVTLKNKQGAITFDHAKHAGVKCETCHETATGGKSKITSKETGHATCLECHKANKEKGAKADCKSCHSGEKSA